MKLNSEILDQRNRGKNILIEYEENIISLINLQRIEKSSPSQQSQRYQFYFDIITGENIKTLKQCYIKFYVNFCYQSCKGCSEDVSNSNYENHNCIECNEGYYPFSE